MHNHALYIHIESAACACRPAVISSHIRQTFNMTIFLVSTSYMTSSLLIDALNERLINESIYRSSLLIGASPQSHPGRMHPRAPTSPHTTPPHHYCTNTRQLYVIVDCSRNVIGDTWGMNKTCITCQQRETDERRASV